MSPCIAAKVWLPRKGRILSIVSQSLSVRLPTPLSSSSPWQDRGRLRVPLEPAPMADLEGANLPQTSRETKRRLRHPKQPRTRNSPLCDGAFSSGRRPPWLQTMNASQAEGSTMLQPQFSYQLQLHATARSVGTAAISPSRCWLLPARPLATAKAARQPFAASARFLPVLLLPRSRARSTKALCAAEALRRPG